MRKFLAFACVLLLSICVFTGCKTKDPSIHMSTYFQNTVSVSYIDSNKETTASLALSTFTTNTKPTLKQYTSLQLTGDSVWLYGMYIEYILFDIVATQNAEIGFTFTLTNLTTGNDQSITTGTKSYTENMVIDAKTSVQTKRIEINDTVASNSVSTLLKFVCTTQEIFQTNGIYNNFGYAIYNIRVVGEHK